MTTSTDLTNRIVNHPIGNRTVATNEVIRWQEHALRGVTINSDVQRELDQTIREYVHDNGTFAVNLAVLVERARQHERATVIAELAPEQATAELVAQARADERAMVEAEAAADYAVMKAEVEAEHQAELDRLRGAWGVVTAALTAP